MAKAWQVVEAMAEQGLAAWVPGLVTFAIAITVAMGLAILWRWPLKPIRGLLFDAVSAADTFIVTYGSWAVGTRIKGRDLRWILLSALLFALGTLGAFAPGNWSYLALLLGMVAILIVYRHWSWDEDEVEAEVPDEEKRIPISGNLRNEVLTAVAFLFFYFPIAFARLQADGIAFSFLPGSGVVAFTSFTLLEFVKAVPFIDYYEIFGSDLQFERIANVAGPSLSAKFLTLGLRASFDLVLVASLLRLPQIAKLAQEGRDLRPIDEALGSNDETRQEAAVESARRFALRRRTRARDRLIQVTQQRLSSDLFRYPINVRTDAARALRDVGLRLNDDATLHASAAAYRQILKERPREAAPVPWANRQIELGDILLALADQRPDTVLIDEAIAALRAAQTLYARDLMSDKWAEVESKLGAAFGMIAWRTRDPAAADAALASYRAALEETPRDKAPLAWAKTQLRICNMLCDRGVARGDAGEIEAGISACRAALTELTRERDAWNWARAKDDLGRALFDVWVLKGDDARAEEAIASFRDALGERTEARAPLAWASTQMSLANVLSRLGRQRKDAQMLKDAIAAYRGALKHAPRAQAPLDWALRQHNLGNALSGLGELSGDARLLGEAIAAYRESLGERTRERVPHDWAMTHHNLGNAHLRLGKLRNDPASCEKAIVAYRTALEERTVAAAPLERAATLTSLAGALARLARLRRDPALIEEAIALCDKALEIRGRDRHPYLWASTTAEKAEFMIDLAEVRTDPAPLERAAADLSAAIAVLKEHGANDDANDAQSELTRCENLAAQLRLTRSIREP
jgi:tetratricopeptide (TPR) repeat protein